MSSEKERLIQSFFKIRGNQQNEKLQNLKGRCEKFLLEEDDSEISDLINMINALTIYSETGDKDEARKWVIEIWYKLYSKTDFSLFEIRF